MFKLILMCRRKPGLSRKEFIDYYENTHVPLAQRLGVAPPGYRRNYLALDDPVMELIPAELAATNADFDVITESIFNTREDATAALARFADPEIQKVIGPDESNFVEPGSIRFVVVESHGLPEGKLDT
jgi:hypothetical protein